MRSAIIQTARKRYTVRHILSVAVFLALAYGITRNEGVLLGLAFALAVSELANILREAPTVDSRWVSAGGGVFITLGSFAWFWYEATVSTAEGILWLPGLTALAGIWLLFDSYQDFIDGQQRGSSPRDNLRMSETMLVMNHTHLIAEKLKTGPKTVEELTEACDLTESRVREALDIATDDEIIYRMDREPPADVERYALDESKVGKGAFVRVNGRRLARRLAQPFSR